MIDCPECDDGDLAVIHETPNHVTLRCDSCGHMHRESPRHLRAIEVPLIISDGAASHRSALPVASTDEVRVNDEFEHDGHRMLVTAIEGPDGPVRSARMADIKALHAKLFDQVAVKFSINEGETTRSYTVDMEPEQEVHVGEVLDLEGRLAVVKTLKSDQNRTLHRGFLLARNVRRAFCDPAPSGTRRGQRVATRTRGAPPTKPGTPKRGGPPRSKPRR